MSDKKMQISEDCMMSYSQDTIQCRILTIRGVQVLMDADIAEFYQVKTIALNQAVKRNAERFPERYRFQLTEEEKAQLITNCDRFQNRNSHVTLDCYVKRRFATAELCEAFEQYRIQYPEDQTTLHTFELSHDRWLIIDETVYHFGASLKDLGKRWFAVNVVTEISADDLISRL